VHANANNISIKEANPDQLQPVGKDEHITQTLLTNGLKLLKIKCITQTNDNLANHA